MPESYFETFMRAVDACSDRDGILGNEYLEFPPREELSYQSSPRNALTFGRMGVDGVLYAVLKIDDEVCDDSPIIQIAPMDFSEPYSLLGDSLLEYFALACGVSQSEMDTVFQRERSGRSVLVEFMRQRFDQTRLFHWSRRDDIDHIRHLLDVPPW